MTDTIFVGVDVSVKTNQVCILDSSGKTLDRCTVRNSLDGSSQLVHRMLSVLQRTRLSHIQLGMEATSVYGEGLLLHLKQDQSLKPYPCQLFMLNPRQVHQFKSSYNDLPKTDNIDSFVIADCLRFGRFNLKEIYMEEKFKALQRLTRARYQVARNLSREKNRYLNHLFLKFSALVQEDIFSNNLGATATALVEEFLSLDEISYMPIDQLADFIRKKGKGKFPEPEQLAAIIQKAARSSYRLPKVIEGSVNQALALSHIAMKAYLDQLKMYDEAIRKHIQTIPNPLISIKGVGPVYAAGMLAEIGDIHRFKDQAALAKFAGLTWTRKQSGEYESDYTRLIPSGNRYLRYYLIEAANLARRHDPELMRFYNLKYRETPRTPHKRALVLTARKFVRLVFALLRDNRLYTPSRVEEEDR